MPARARHRLSVAVFVVLVRGTAVCLLRRSNTGWMDGHYSLPAGALEPGETIRDAAIREASEEVGVAIDPASLRHAHVVHSRPEGSDWVGHFFNAASWTGEPRICEPDKHAELCWAPLARVPPLTIPYVGQALACIGRSESYSEYGWGGI